jgi:lipid-A-disaccharide synthase
LKYYIIAGEASGDLHASNLLKELKKLDAGAEFRGWGGDLMQAQGTTLVKHIRQLAFMGFTEVLMNIRTILGNIKLCKQDILLYQPDALILVDYPGFNLRIAQWAKQQGIKVHYYISPQVWAWKESRVKAIRRDVDHLYCILPFEVDFYAKHGMQVEFVGHPLLDAIQEVTTGQRDNNLIALLPGSRKQEIKRMLPVMLEVSRRFPEYRFVVAGAPSQDAQFYQPFLAGYPNVQLWENRTYALLAQSHAAMVTSGTATLETALFNVPEVVCYKGGAVSYMIARRLVKVKYISLVNLVMDSPVVAELIQRDMNPDRLEAELRKILQGPDRDTMLHHLKDLQAALGGPGASARIANRLWKNLQS